MSIQYIYMYVYAEREGHVKIACIQDKASEKRDIFVRIASASNEG